MKRNRMLCVILSAFIVLSFLGLQRPQDRSSAPKAAEVTVERKLEGNLEWYIYVNQESKPIQPSDRDYAILVNTYDEEGRLVLEQYQDVDRNPVRRTSGLSAVAYFYEKDAVKLCYLDTVGQPISITSGYAKIYRTTTPEGKILRDSYFDVQGNPVRCTAGYHSYERIYDEQGRVTALQFLDESGKPVKNRTGYSREERILSDNGRIMEVTYYDEQGMPTTNTAGQYGERYVRDEKGRVTQITYLDGERNPAPNKAGYTILRRSYDAEGKLYEDRYYDGEGRPTATSKGQYGVRYVNGIALQINRFGWIKLSADNLINGFPYVVVMVGVLLCISMTLLPPKPRALLLAAYVVFIFYETLMFRESGDPRTALIPFSYLKQFALEYTVRAEVIDNIWLFIPLGAGLYSFCPKRKILWLPFALTLFIETAQFATGLGLAQTDDVIGNTLGGIIGFLMAGQFKKNERRMKVD